MKKAIIVGASSGIGRALAKELAGQGVTVGVTARRVELLESLREEMTRPIFSKQMDIADTAAAMSAMEELIDEMEGVDLVIIAAGIVRRNKDLDWQPEQETIATNVMGFTAIANVAMRHFIKQNSGHLVSLSSIAALRGDAGQPAYHASKAFVSIYMDSLRRKTVKEKLPISITDIQPGFVDTVQTHDVEGLFWVASPEKAAAQIYRAILGKRKHAYVTKRWRLIAWFTKLTPDFVFDRLA